MAEVQQKLLGSIDQLVRGMAKREPRLFSRSGQERRAWLDDKSGDLAEGVRYFLGAGTGLPERADLAANMINPLVDVETAMVGARDAAKPGAAPLDRVSSIGDMLTGMAGVGMSMNPLTKAAALGAGDMVAKAEPQIADFVAAEAGNMPLGKLDDLLAGITPQRMPDDVTTVKLKKGAPRPEADPAGPFAPKADPRYTGAAPDRSDISFLRYTPKQPTPRMARAMAAMQDPSNPARAAMMEDIKRGVSPEVRGQDWYNTEELRDWFVNELGEEQGHAEWSQFMDLMGAGSPMSNVPSNIKSASAMRNRLAIDPGYREGLENVQNLDDARVYGSQRPSGYGHQSQGLQELIHARQRQGAWAGAPEPGVSPAAGSWTDNPKPKGFTNSLKGNTRNIAADLHFTRYMAMGSNDPEWLSGQAGIGKAAADALTARFPKAADYIQTKDVKGKPVITFNAKKAAKDGAVDLKGLQEFDIPSLYADKPNDAEYGHFEQFLKDIGDELDMTPAQTQAALWMGAADRTGLDPSSRGTFMELFRRRVGERAGETGRTFDDTLRDFIRNKGLLSIPAGGVGAALLNQQAGDPKGGT